MQLANLVSGTINLVGQLQYYSYRYNVVSARNLNGNESQASAISNSTAHYSGEHCITSSTKEIRFHLTTQNWDRIRIDQFSTW